MQRSIYTDEQLSVQKYLTERNKLKLTMQSSFVDIKKKQLRKYLEQSPQQSPPPPPWLLANDFIQFLHLIDDTDADFRLLEQLMDVFKLIDVRTLRSVNIGSILMKMLHHFKRDASALKVSGNTTTSVSFDRLNFSLALQFYSDPVVRQSFLTGKQSNLIYLDLLFKQKKYVDLLEQFGVLREYLTAKQLPIIRSIYVLVFATCYCQVNFKRISAPKWLMMVLLKAFLL